MCRHDLCLPFCDAVGYNRAKMRKTGAVGTNFGPWISCFGERWIQVSVQTEAGGARKRSTAYLAKVSMLGALAFVIMVIEFAIPIFPVYLKLDFSDLIPLVGAFALGPVAGMMIQLIKNILHVLLMSDTGGVGELANFIVGSAFVMAAGAYYKGNRTKRGALVGLLLGTVTVVVAGAVVNFFITIPLYGLVMGWSEAMIVDLGAMVIPWIHNKLTLILFAFCPFNLLKGILLSALCLLIYKHVSPLLKIEGRR